MRDLKHILLPTDFSANSRSALPAACALARQSGATLHLLHVIPPASAARQILAREGLDSLDQDVRKLCQKELNDLASAATAGRVEVHLAEGEPAEEIEDFIGAHDIDLVAIATKGHSGLARVMLGSTTEKVVRRVPCPVLVVRESPRFTGEFTKILVPIDFSELAQVALAEAVELVRGESAQILLVHVIEETDYPMGHVLQGQGILDVREQTRRAVQDHLETVQKKIAASIFSSVMIREGVAASATIADVALDEGADLVLIATHARGGLARFVLGSTAERVVRLSPCSVLVLKQKRK